jgi:hypothetical protein
MTLFGQRAPVRAKIAGVDLRCPVCGSFLFWERTAQLNSAVSAFFGLSWVDRSATCYVCDMCGHVLWFMSEP